jgi:YVTN family beta-propeller protein
MSMNLEGDVVLASALIAMLITMLSTPAHTKKQFGRQLVSAKEAKRSGRAAVFLQFLLLFAGLVCSPPACAQDWQWKKTIAVGESPQQAALASGGRELYVSNQVGGTVSVIDTASGERTTDLPVGSKITGPSAIVASHDGSRVYVVVENAVRADGTDIGHALAVINTADKSVSYVPLPGVQWDGLAITHDDRRLYMAQVKESDTGFPHGAVYVFDTGANQLRSEPVIQEALGCPFGIAISEKEQRLYVDYQCYGPEGDRSYPARDSIGVYELPPPNPGSAEHCDRNLEGPQGCIGVIKVQPNVGGPLALSPDGSQLWANGWDACSAPYYYALNQSSCPTFPGLVTHVFRTSDLKLLKTYAFSLEDARGRISFSPEGETFVGDGIYLKELASGRLESEGASDNRVPVNCGEQDQRHGWECLPIASVGDVVFRQDEKTKTEYMYVTVSDKNVVYVMERAEHGVAVRYDVPLEAPVSKLTLPTVVSVLGTHGSYGRCVSDGTCIRVKPEDLAWALAKRGPSERLQDCGKQVAEAQTENSSKHPPSELYRCVANEVLSVAPSEETGRMQAIDSAMELRALEANEDFMEFRTGFIAKQQQLAQLQEKLKAKPTQSDQEEFKKLSKQVDEERQDSRSFKDVTSRLGDPSSLQKSLEDSAVILSVFSWGEHTYTVLISRGGKTLQEDKDDQGSPVPQPTLEKMAGDFLAKLQTANDDPHPPAEAKELYNILIGNAKVSEALTSDRNLAPQHKLTLVWLVEGTLRYIPMAALSYDDDGQRYLAELYSNALLTTPSAPEAAEPGNLKGLAAGTSFGGLPSVPLLLRSLFSSQQPPIPATLLLEQDFTAAALSSHLRQLEENVNSDLFVHIASHFALQPGGEEESYLQMGDGTRLSLRDISHEEEYPFRGLDLVTFSACETAGVTPGRNGSEIEGLAFHLDERGNGARAVLATLWNIQPQPAYELMKRFYAGLQQGMSKAESLQQAENAVFPEGPHYWAPFILVGDWH